MQIRQIEAFIAVAQERSFSKAADRLDVRQPSLSGRIQQLEHSLGATLIQRNTRPIQLTRVGTIFLDYATRAVGILGAGKEAINNVQAGMVGRVVVGCPTSVATYLMPDVIELFSERFPHIDLHLEAGASEMVVSRLTDGLNNLTFAAAFPGLAARGHTEIRLSDRMVVAVSPAHPLAQKEEVTTGDIWSYRLLLIHWGVAFSSYLASLREMYAGTVNMVHVPLAAALPMASRSDAVTFLPKRMADAAGMRAIPIPSFNFPWDVVALTRPGYTLRPAEYEFLKVVEEVWQRG